MKSEKGLMHLLIWVEAVALVLIVLLVIAKQVTEPQEQIAAPIDVQENQIENLITQSEASTENQTEESEEIEPVVFSAEVEEMLAVMSVEEKVAQLFIVTPEILTGTDRVTVAGRGTRSALAEYPVGGILYSRDNFLGQTQMRDLLAGAQSMSKELTGRELFVGTIVENNEGSVIVCAAEGQESALITLIAADTPLIEEAAGMEQIDYVQSMENYVRSDEKLECYNVVNGGQSAIDALNAGVDMLYTAEDFENVYRVVLEAANTGQLSEETVRQAVGRVLTKKQEFSRQVVEE